MLESNANGHVSLDSHVTISNRLATGKHPTSCESLKKSVDQNISHPI
jgi:hypothetical protein